MENNKITYGLENIRQVLTIQDHHLQEMRKMLQSLRGKSLSQIQGELVEMLAVLEAAEQQIWAMACPEHDCSAFASEHRMTMNPKA